MHDEAYPHEEDPHANAGAPTAGDESHEASDAPGRRPIPEFFSRRAAKDTGRTTVPVVPETSKYGAPAPKPTFAPRQFYRRYAGRWLIEPEIAFDDDVLGRADVGG